FRVGGLFDEARYRVGVMARVLDDGPAARFRSRLIDGQGLAYSLWCDVDLYVEGGGVEIGAQVSHERVADVVEAICRELASLGRRPPRVEEVARVRARLARDLDDMRDNPAHVAESAARGALVGLPLRPQDTLAQVSAIEPAAVSATARDVFRQDRAVLVLVGKPRRADVKRAEAALASFLR
ncbi:MAG: M16 family metallopeptidase, partial [Myxococcota bacterium]